MVIIVPTKRQVDGEVAIANAVTTELLKGEQQLFLPLELLDSINSWKNRRVYFDLESYAFFEKAKGVIQQALEPKGVFRMRRLVEKLDKHRVAADVFVLSNLFGNPIDVFIKEAKKSLQHLIVTINFGNGCMTQLDYTTAKQEYVEMEWSGNGKIIEFSSVEMNPFQPRHFTAAPLTYNADVLMKNSRVIDEELLLQLDVLYERIVGGDTK